VAAPEDAVPEAGTVADGAAAEAPPADVPGPLGALLQAATPRMAAVTPAAASRRLAAGFHGQAQAWAEGRAIFLPGTWPPFTLTPIPGLLSAETLSPYGYRAVCRPF
jgi:hypothetical protein